MLRRQRELQGRQLRRAILSPDMPAELLIMDEIAMLTAYGDSKIIRQVVQLLGETMTQGRAGGFTVWAFLQEPLKDILPVRDLFTSRICLSVAASSHVDAALGADMRDRGAFADEIPLDDPKFTGVGFRAHKASRQVRRIRVGHATDADIAELVATCAPDQGPRLTVVGEVA
jgi:S-DNA-T family DNA segregation ATPase FtsK/SpoIIIE